MTKVKRARAPRRRGAPTPADQLVASSEAMLTYALASGANVPEGVVEVVFRASEQRRLARAADGEEADPVPDLRRLIRAHAELMRLVAPATPRTIMLVSEGRQSALSMLGPVRLVRQMLVAVLILLTAFILLSSSGDVNANSGDIFTSDGLDLLVNELFFLAAGGLGAAFSALFTAYRYISEGTYDPKYESTYWLRFILGLMSGLLLAALIPIGGDTESHAFTKPLLALIGGFSASVLYRILERLVSAVESLVRGDTRELRAAEREVISARAREQAGLERFDLVTDLRRLEADARAGAEPAQVADTVKRILHTITPASATAFDESEPPAHAATAESSRRSATASASVGSATSSGISTAP